MRKFVPHKTNSYYCCCSRGEYKCAHTYLYMCVSKTRDNLEYASKIALNSCIFASYVYEKYIISVAIMSI